MGGLNYQIEHHLFPNMPRPHLRKAQEIVKEYCEAHTIPYTETGLFQSLRHRHRLPEQGRAVGPRPVRLPDDAAVPRRTSSQGHSS